MQRDLVLKGEMTHWTPMVMNPINILTRLDDALDEMPKRLAAVQAQLQNLMDQREAAKIEADKPFPREDELKVKSARLAELDILLNMDGRTQQTGQDMAKSVRPSVLENLKRPLPPKRPGEKKPKRPPQVR